MAEFITVAGLLIITIIASLFLREVWKDYRRWGNDILDLVVILLLVALVVMLLFLMVSISAEIIMGHTASVVEVEVLGHGMRRGSTTYVKLIPIKSPDTELIILTDGKNIVKTSNKNWVYKYKEGDYFEVKKIIYNSSGRVDFLELGD